MRKTGNGLCFLELPVFALGHRWAGFLTFFAALLFVFPASAQTGPDEEIECLALTIYFEARGEPFAGKVAVGHVVMNRVADPAFPESICDVVRQGGGSSLYKCQFTWWCDGLSDEPVNPKSWHQCRRIAYLVYHGYTVDPTDEALWYHADYVRPPWAEILSRGPTIGQHIFYGKADSPMEDGLKDDGPLLATAGSR